MFTRCRQTKQFCEARFVRLAGRTIATGLDPIWMLHAQSVVDLLLKLRVRTDLLGGNRRCLHFHLRRYRRPGSVVFRVRRIFEYHSRGDPDSLVRDRTTLATASIWVTAKMAFTCDFTVPSFEIEGCQAAHTAFLLKPDSYRVRHPANAGSVDRAVRVDFKKRQLAKCGLPSADHASKTM